jgi:hypothetical protein
MSTILLGGCWGSTVGTVSLKAVCGTPEQDYRDASWQGIDISKNDKLTKGTAKDILGNNVAHDKVCGEQAKPKLTASNYP